MFVTECVTEKSSCAQSTWKLAVNFWNLLNGNHAKNAFIAQADVHSNTHPATNCY